MLKVRREQVIHTDIFELGDEIKFKLTTGEKVHAKAVQECDGGMLFITKDCIGKEMPMYKNTSEKHLDYVHSDMRVYLNSELLSLFPEKIRNRMRPMMVGDSYGDYIRIPTEKEIFGNNPYGIEESDTQQFYGMNYRRNRIAFEHTNGIDEWQWYWLQNYVASRPRTTTSGASFANVYDDGDADYLDASHSAGVRPVFTLANKKVS